ncbi:MAG: shikimate dehydrogenase [Saprospiraceae bacterium]|nr:shikimate dehydrogenase [Saprospiraceae bacterium]
MGKSLTHSFSKFVFESIFSQNNINNTSYSLIEISDLPQLRQFFRTQAFQYSGLNITVPYKLEVLPFLNKLTTVAQEIGAVNCIKYVEGQWEGHNTDGPAFLEILNKSKRWNSHALVLGNGGASKAIQWALKKSGITFDLVSRTSKEYNFENLNQKWNNQWNTIIQTTPVGMFPNSHETLNFPFDRMNEEFLVYDLIYNPVKTKFLLQANEQGARIYNGQEMLEIQALLSYEYWNREN